jgi:hypothetical protein
MHALCCEAKIVSPSQRLAHHITMPRVNYYAAANHEAASKFVGQASFTANYSANWPAEPQPEPNELYGLPPADPVEWGPNGGCVAREIG